MAAILPFLETEPSKSAHSSHDVLDGLGKVSGKFMPMDELAVAHTSLTRLAWARKLIAKELEGRTFTLEEELGDVYVRITPPLRSDVVPWHKSAGDALNRFQLFSTNSKMACPTFDLPSGVGELGGSCPGARWAQSSVSHEKSLLTESDAKYAEGVIGHPIKLLTSVCEFCYASGGKYGEVVVQFAEVGRFAFIRSMMSSSATKAQLISLLKWVITRKLRWSDKDVSRRHGRRTGHKLKPVRVHSSGDFFSPAYAELWMEVARQVAEIDKDIQFWAPTRTHVLKQFVEMWKKPGFIPPNFTIRPSAYHVGDPAPQRVNAANSQGTGVLSVQDAKDGLVGSSKFKLNGKKADHICGVYALVPGNKTCKEATAPDGKKGCRACWVQQDLAIGYVLH